MVQPNKFCSTFHHVPRHNVMPTLHPTAHLCLALKHDHFVSKAFQFEGGRHQRRIDEIAKIEIGELS